MTHKSLNSIIKKLPKLTEDERKQVRMICGHLGTSSDSPSNSEHVTYADLDEKFLLFYDILATKLKDTTGTKLPKRATYLPKPLLHDLERGWRSVEDLLGQILDKPRYSQRLKFYEIVVETTIEYVGVLGIIVTARIIAKQLRNCGGILNNQFPGYFRTGLLSVILSWGKPGTSPDVEDL